MKSAEYTKCNDTASSAAAGRRTYEAPTGQWHDLRVITLGGATGIEDSGNPNLQELIGSTGAYDGPSRGNPYKG